MQNRIIVSIVYTEHQVMNTDEVVILGHILQCIIRTWAACGPYIRIQTLLCQVYRHSPVNGSIKKVNTL